MKITCPCGALITDQTDDLPHKAHVVPDQEWFAVFDAIDTVIAEVGAGRASVDAAQTRFRSILVAASRLLYQCQECGRLFVPDQQHKIFPFTPCGTDVDREILRSRDRSSEA